jgi:hypothetical protein
MAKDVLITPASGLIEFKDNEGNVDSSIQLNDSNVLVITGTISLGDLAADVYIGDGVNEVDIVYEQNGGIYGLAGKTLTLGLANSYLSLAANVTSGANITGNLLTGGQVVATGNVTSSGNVSGTYLLGNVFYATGFSASKIYNGTSQINIGTSGGAANISIGGTSNVAVFSSTGVAITGDLSVSGNATLSGNILGDRLQNGTTSIDIQTASGNANISVAGTSNVVVFSSSGQNVAGYITSTGNISGSYILGNGSQLTGLPALYGNSNVAAYLASGLDTANIVTTGNISGGNILGNGAGLTGINAFSNISVNGGNSAVADSISDTLTLTAGSGITLVMNSATDTLTIAASSGSETFVDGADFGTVTEEVTASDDLGLVTAAVQAESDLGSIVTSGVIYPDLLVVENIEDFLLYSGNTGQYLGTAGNGVLQWQTLDSAPLEGSMAGNINGNSYSITSLAILTATGNITGGNIVTAGLGSFGTTTVTGNITGGNLTTAGQITATGNITGGNLTTAGQITATGNITGGNLTTAGQITATGNITTAGTLTATTIVESSSITLKENIRPLENSLDALTKLVAVLYDRRDGTIQNEPGLIAEDVNKILPDLVVKDLEGNPVGIRYSKITVYLIEAIKSLKQDIDNLQKRL